MPRRMRATKVPRAKVHRASEGRAEAPGIAAAGTVAVIVEAAGTVAAIAEVVAEVEASIVEEVPGAWDRAWAWAWAAV